GLHELCAFSSWKTIRCCATSCGTFSTSSATNRSSLTAPRMRSRAWAWSSPTLSCSTSTSPASAGSTSCSSRPRASRASRSWRSRAWRRSARLSFALPDGDGTLEVSAMLVRSDGRGYAFDFVSPTEGQLGRLREFVQRRDAGAARAVEPHFRVLRAISRALSLSLDVDQMLRIALDALTRVTGHEVSSLHLLSDARWRPEPIRDAGSALPEAAANQISLALDNARLYSETRTQLDEIKQAETQRAEGERLSTVGKLAAGLVHEINNPLTVILGQAELVMTELADSTRGRERVRIILQETSRAARLLQQVLQLAQPQPSERRPCALLDPEQW